MVRSGEAETGDAPGGEEASLVLRTPGRDEDIGIGHVGIAPGPGDELNPSGVGLL
jgi:hypothetical protein